MSLNRSEQLLHDYLQSHRDERQYWQGKVQKIARERPDPAAAVARLDGELWRYFLERSDVAEPFKSFAHSFGPQRTSMKNLAEYLLRLWVAPRPPPRDRASKPQPYSD